VVPLLLDENLADDHVARRLQAAGFSICTPQTAGLRTLDDESILEAAAHLGAVVVTYNQGDFKRLHEAWQTADRHHGGIIVAHKLPLGVLSLAWSTRPACLRLRWLRTSYCSSTYSIPRNDPERT